MTNQHHSFWSDARVETLVRLHRKGNSYAEIAAKIPGATKNMCVSKGTRIGLTTPVGIDEATIERGRKALVPGRTQAEGAAGLGMTRGRLQYIIHSRQLNGGRTRARPVRIAKPAKLEPRRTNSQHLPPMGLR